MKPFDPRSYFAHKQAIRKANRRFFAGRKDIFPEAVDGLGVPGSAGVIFGERGVGKTSFAWQLLEILRGDCTLLDKLGVKPALEIRAHECLWVQCRKGMVDIHGALLALMRPGQRADRNIPRVFPELLTPKKKAAVERTYKLGLPVAQATLKFTDEDQKVQLSGLPRDLRTDLATRDAQIEDMFYEALGAIADVRGAQELLIFFDEFDRLPVTEGAGEFIKGCNDAKIVVVGVADQVQEIIRDHESCARKLVGTKFCLPNLNREEIHELFENVEELTRRDGYELVFDSAFIDTVFDSCDGYPPHVQLLGFASLMAKVRHGEVGKRIRIDRVDFDVALDELLQGPEGELDTFEQIQLAIGDSPNRARILLRMAEHEPGWIQESYAQLALKTRAVRHLETHLERLEKTGVVKRDPGGDRIKFATPALRSVVRMAGKKRLMP